ncbi:MAG: hypothetical protein ACLQU1_00170 [Bryobacteraceae bacterium]
MTASRLFSTAILMACAAAGWADTITMKDGRVFVGTYVGGNARQIRVDLGPEVRTFDISDVARIEFSNAAPAAAPAPPSDRDRPVLRRAPDASQTSDPSQPTAPPSDPDRPILRRAPDATDPSQPVAPPYDGDRPVLHRADDAVLRPDPSQPAQPAGPIQLAAGTNFVIRLIDSVDSQTASQGQSFAASMDQPVVVNGRTVIPRGANAVMRLVDTTPSGTFTGRTELALALISVKVNDRYVPINTQTVTRVSDARGQQTAKVVGGTAAVGAIIGAIAGGGKGAAIGAGAGGAAGAGAQAITKGQRVKIPSETRLTFTLENPVTI